MVFATTIVIISDEHVQISRNKKEREVGAFTYGHSLKYFYVIKQHFAIVGKRHIAITVKLLAFLNRQK